MRTAGKDRDTLKQVPRRSVKDQVFEQLRDQILKRVWLPGSKIPSEHALAEQLGVSRISVREAVKMLSSLGLLETKRGGGTFVRQYRGEVFFNPLIPMLALDSTDVYDVLEYRKIVERGTVALVAETADEATIESLERAYAAMQGEAVNDHAFAVADLDFHLALAKATGNPIIVKINDIIKSILSVSMESVVHSLGYNDGLVYHRKIIDAIKARDRDGAERLMDEHIQRTIDRLKAVENSGAL